MGQPAHVPSEEPPHHEAPPPSEHPSAQPAKPEPPPAANVPEGEEAPVPEEGAAVPEAPELPNAPEGAEVPEAPALEEGVVEAAPEEATEEAPPPASAREADVEATLQALTAPGPKPAPTVSDGLRQRLARWASLWRSLVAARAAEVAGQRAELEAQNSYLRHQLRTLPDDVRDGKVRTAQTRASVKEFQEWAHAYDRIFDGIQASAAEAPARTAAYRRKLELARKAQSDPDTIASFVECVHSAERTEADLAAMARLVVANVGLCGQLLAGLDAAIADAQQRALLRRTDVRITAATFSTLASDVRRLLAWRPGLAEVGEGWSAGALAARLVGLAVVAVLLWMLGRRIRMRLVARLDSSLAEAPEDEHARALWRARLGLRIVQTALLFAFIVLALLLLRLPDAWLLALTAFAAAWCGYHVACLLLRMLLSPGQPALRLLPCDDAAAPRLFGAANVLLVSTAIFLPLLNALRDFDYPHADVVLLLRIVYGLLLLAGFAWLTHTYSRHPFVPLHGAAPVPRPLGGVGWLHIALPVACVLVAGDLLILIPGYANLSAYLGRGFALTALVCGAAAAAQEWIRPHLARRVPVPAQWDEPGATGRTVLHYAERVGLLVVVWLLLMAVWGVRAHHIEAVIAFLSTPLLNIKGTRISIVGFVNGALVILAAYGLARFLRARIERSGRFALSWDRGMRYAVGSVVYYGVLVGGIVLGILVAGLQLNILVAFAGMVGIAVGFGSQDIAKNIICGLIILLDRSINVGDFVEVAGQKGVIVGISVRSTTVRTPDNRLLIVPNSTFYTQNIVVSSQRDPRVCLTVDVAVAPDTDLDDARRVLLEATQSLDHILREPPVEVAISKLAANALNLQLTAWTDHLGDPSRIQTLLVTAIWRALKAHGIAPV